MGDAWNHLFFLMNFSRKTRGVCKIIGTFHQILVSKTRFVNVVVKYSHRSGYFRFIYLRFIPIENNIIERLHF